MEDGEELRRMNKQEREKLRLKFLSWLVGMARFELTTSCSQSRRSNLAELLPDKNQPMELASVECILNSSEFSFQQNPRPGFKTNPT